MLKSQSSFTTASPKFLPERKPAKPFSAYTQDELRAAMERADGVCSKRTPGNVTGKKLTASLSPAPPSPMQRKLLEVMRAGGWWTSRELTQKLGCNRKTTTSILQRLKEKGLVISVESEGAPNTGHMWRVV
jgi:predicted HTH transcriptional regulator